MEWTALINNINIISAYFNGSAFYVTTVIASRSNKNYWFICFYLMYPQNNSKRGRKLSSFFIIIVKSKKPIQVETEEGKPVFNKFIYFIIKI